MVPTVGAGFVGFALMLIFLPTMNYVIDCYLFVAASALAANTFLRSAMAAVFPLFSHQMFVNLTNKYAGTILAGLGVLLLPVPIAFRVYGKRFVKTVSTRISKSMKNFFLASFSFQNQQQWIMMMTI